MARHLSRSDLRMLRVLREASEQDQMRRKLERLRVKESHENEMKLRLSTTSHSNHNNQDDDRNEMVEEGETEKDGTEKTRTSIETPRSRFLRECSESMELTGPQTFGIAVLKRDD